MEMDALLAIKIAIEILENEKQLVRNPDAAAEEANPGKWQNDARNELQGIVDSVEQGAVMLYWP
jgi:hypothetical protein